VLQKVISVPFPGYYEERARMIIDRTAASDNECDIGCYRIQITENLLVTLPVHGT